MLSFPPDIYLEESMAASEPLKHLRQMLWASLSERMKAHGFRGRRAHGDWIFEKRYEFGTGKFCVYFVKHPHDFDVTLSVFVRHDAIEEIAQRESWWLNDEEKGRVSTLGNDIGYLTAGEPMRWTVGSAADVERVAAQIEEQFVDVALPYISRYGDINNAYAVLASTSPADRFHVMADYGRAMGAVAAALVLKRDKKEVGELVARLRAFLTNGKYVGVERFEHLVKSLGL
jgi:hypothetical protein